LAVGSSSFGVLQGVRLRSIQSHCDEAQYIVTNNSSKDARYVVPARCQKYIEHAKVNDITGDGDNTTSICTGDIVAPEEIKLTFRTPCRFLMVGIIAIKI
jgi:hypothetical protein